MRNLRMTIAYDGTAYVGWQVQPNGPTIQQAVTVAIRRLTGESTNVLSAGRTDSGVHALGQVASFQTASPIPVDSFRKALQKFLPPDIILRDVQEVPADFHATYSAKCKRYRYVIHNSQTHNPFLRNYVWHFHAPLDAGAMHDAGQVLLGRHDFRCFESHWPNKASSVRTIMEVTVQRAATCPLLFGVGSANTALPDGTIGSEDGHGPASESGGDFIWIDVVADGFLYNMVRAIVGTLIPVGRGRWSCEDVRRVLETMDRSAAGDTAPAHGLYLMKVDYADVPEQ